MFSLSRGLLPMMARQLTLHQAGQRAMISTTSRLRASDDPLLQQGDFPRTKEERERAAKKYNLIPEDYEPYPEEEGWGDYPKLKAVGAYNRDWYDDYDDILEHKFWGEPLHLHDDLYFWERIDPLADEKPAQFKLWVKCVLFSSLCAGPFLIYWFVDHFDIHLNHRYKMRKFQPPGSKIYDFPSVEGSQHHHHH